MSTESRFIYSFRCCCCIELSLICNTDTFPIRLKSVLFCGIQHFNTRIVSQLTIYSFNLNRIKPSSKHTNKTKNKTMPKKMCVALQWGNQTHELNAECWVPDFGVLFGTKVNCSLGHTTDWPKFLFLATESEDVYHLLHRTRFDAHLTQIKTSSHSRMRFEIKILNGSLSQ